MKFLLVGSFLLIGSIANASSPWATTGDEIRCKPTPFKEFGEMTAFLDKEGREHTVQSGTEKHGYYVAIEKKNLHFFVWAKSQEKCESGENAMKLMSSLNSINIPGLNDIAREKAKGASEIREKLRLAYNEIYKTDYDKKQFQTFVIDRAPKEMKKSIEKGK